jgi:hypothetical protein
MESLWLLLLGLVSSWVLKHRSLVFLVTAEAQFFVFIWIWNVLWLGWGG